MGKRKIVFISLINVSNWKMYFLEEQYNQNKFYSKTMNTNVA